MADHSNIEWTDASWSPIRARNLKTGKVGWHCEHDTTGCEFCYAESMNKRLGTGLPFKPGHRKDIEIFLDDKMLTAPLRWKKPRMIFVCSMTDLFAEFVPDEWIDRVFAVMALCPQHTFQVLTKRAERMRGYMLAGDDEKFGLPKGEGSRRTNIVVNSFNLNDTLSEGRNEHLFTDNECLVEAWPLPNVWLGVSTERQQEADERIPLLLQTPAAVRFISAEPLLGPINLTRCGSHYTGSGPLHLWQGGGSDKWRKQFMEPPPEIDWVIVGGESGKNARPMHPDWARDIQNQCEAAGVPFFFKQWGEHAPRYDDNLKYSMVRVGKQAAGRLLDGREWNEFPVIKGLSAMTGFLPA